MAAELLLLGGGAAAAVIVTTADGPAPHPTKLAPNGGVPLPGSPPPGSSVQPSRRVLSVVGSARGPAPVGTFQPGIHATSTSNSGTGSGTSSDDPQINGKLQEIEAGAKLAYDKLSSEAKQKGAQEINGALGTNLTGNEDYEKVATVVGGAIGGAAGGYIGGPFGAKVGAIVGAYLGVKLEDLLAENWDDIQSFISSNWDKVANVGEDIGDYAEDAYDYVSGWF